MTGIQFQSVRQLIKFMIKTLAIVAHRLKQWIAAHLPFLIPRNRGGIHHMLLSVVLVALALVMRLSIAPLNAGMQYVVFFPAVTLAAVAGGFKPGLLATSIGAFLATYFFTPPYYSISMEVLQRAFGGNIVFLMDGLVVSISIEAMHRYRKQLAQELKKSIDLNSVLEESTQHLKNILDNQFAYVVLLDTQGVILEVNNALLDWSGYRREDVINQYFYDLPCWSYNETVQAQLIEAIDAALKGQTLRYDVTVKIGDDFVVVDFQISPVRNKEGRIVGLLPMAVDISLRIKAKEALKKSQTQLKTFIYQAPIAIAIFDRNMNYLETSERWLNEFSRGYANLNGRNHYQVNPDLPEKWKQVHQQCLSGAMLKDDEDMWVRADGSKCWLRWAVMPWINENDAIGGLIISAEDITDRKQNEAHLAEQAWQLRETDRHKDEFLAMLAHELRNPLAPISNAVEILKLTDLEPARIAWCTDIINRQVKHLVRLVDDLLDVSRISRGLVELKKESLEVRDFILPAVETCQPLIDTRRHTFSLALPPEHLWVEGDRIRLAQVVSNLINNAAKYTEEGGHIGLSVEASGNEVCIHVSDNGSGIDPADLSHLFDLFYQADRNIDRSQGGLGIGLSLVHNLVAKHGGNVQAFSAGRGQGSEFVIRLPRLILSPSTLPITAAPAAPGPNKLRILVVDDNRDVVESLALLLESDGHQVLTAYDGISALETARIERPVIILLDIGLPGMDGYSVAQALRRNNGLERTMLIALTGYGQPDDRKKSIASGFDEYLVKPGDIEKLRKLLASYQTTGFHESP
ncbi:ATP-binding protein [Methylobacter sp.]|uniref:hybrid sensor histidine kinase/response regulator n=1 Tax=Methylobacter sp. TaxID=2051955 RepID=UPI0011FFB79B|nr:ATP-binding protein [Methylobacter sp.]TAK64300.1 MAG: PAS domain S-box protein [Methylobacter sp.]